MCRDKQFQDEDELEHLAEMLWYADQAYEGESERTLSKRLEKKGARQTPFAMHARLEKLACRTRLGSACHTWLDSSLAGTLRRPTHRHCFISTLHRHSIVS